MQSRLLHRQLREWRSAFLILTVLISGCSRQYMPEPLEASVADGRLSSEYNAPAHMLPADSASGAVAEAEAAPAMVASRSASLLPLLPASASIAAVPVQPHLVRSVDIYLQADDVHAQSMTLQSLATEMGGYLSALTEDGNLLERTVIQMTVRIPAARLDEAMTRIEALGKIHQRSLTTQDVTLQFVDMQSRLRNLESTEGRLLAHLEQSRDIPSILKVESEVDRVRGEIEVIQGRVNEMANQISFATVRVTLTSNPTAGPITSASAFSTGETFTDAARNLVGFLQGVWFLVIWAVVWSPVWLAIAGIVVYVRRRARRVAPTAD